MSLQLYAFVFLTFFLLSAACLLWGGDSQAGAFLLSGLFLCLGSVLLLFSDGRHLCPGVRVMCSICLLALSLLPGLWGHHLYNLHPEYMVLSASLAIFLIGREQAGQGVAEVVWLLFLILGGVYLIWSILSMYAHPGQLFGLRRAYGQSERFAASFLSANTAATLFGMIGLASYSEFLRVFHTGASKFIWGLVVLLSLAALLMTGSRAGVLFFLLVLLSISLLWYRKGKVVAVVAALLLLAWLGGEAVWQRMGLLEAAIDVRSRLFSAWWRAWLQEPLTGHGLGGFSVARQSVMTAEDALLLEGQGAAHNVFLHWLVQAGVLGSLSMWLLIAMILFDILHSRESKDLCRAVLAVSLFVILHGTLDYALEIPGVSWVWAWMLGLAHGVARKGGV